MVNGGRKVNGRGRRRTGELLPREYGMGRKEVQRLHLKMSSITAKI
jgi:hypothetical protein